MMQLPSVETASFRTLWNHHGCHFHFATKPNFECGTETKDLKFTKNVLINTITLEYIPFAFNIFASRLPLVDSTVQRTAGPFQCIQSLTQNTTTMIRSFALALVAMLVVGLANGRSLPHWCKLHCGREVIFNTKMVNAMNEDAGCDILPQPEICKNQLSLMNVLEGCVEGCVFPPACENPDEIMQEPGIVARLFEFCGSDELSADYKACYQGK